MSKLAHSHQPSMDEIDRAAAIRDGNEDLIPPVHHTVIGGLVRPVSEAPTHYKQMLRLTRRARARHIHLERNPIMGNHQCTLIFSSNIAVMNPVPSRIVRIRDDGSFVAEGLRVETFHGWRKDAYASLATTYNRLSWGEFEWAQECRRQRWLPAARATLAIAADDRRRMGEAS